MAFFVSMDAGQDKKEDREQSDGATPSRPFGDVELAFPVTFDLRIIYVLARGATIQPDLERIFHKLDVPCSLMQGLATPGAKYGRWGSRITLSNREQMYALYAEIGKLPYVKTAI
jgi:putative lipoic acid-binding regulatory protein